MIPWTVNDILEERNKQMNNWRSEISQIPQLKFPVNLLIAVINMKINRRETSQNSESVCFIFVCFIYLYYSFLHKIFLNVPRRVRGRSCAWFARQQAAKPFSCISCSAWYARQHAAKALSVISFSAWYARQPAAKALSCISCSAWYL